VALWFTRTFSALRNRDFRLLWIGAFTSTTGTWMQTVAQSWVVLSLTGSAFLLGADAFLATLPMILFSLVGGVIADRVDRRHILLVSQFLQMSFAIVLALLIYTERVQIWHIFLLSFLTGSVQSFGGPAYQALIPMMVKREEMTNAIAMNSMQFNLARMLGPVLAGLALAAYGAAACFGLNALSFLPVIFTLFMIRSTFVPDRRGERRSILHEMKEGLDFVRRDRVVSQLTFVAFVSTFLGIPLVTLLPVVARETFGYGATGYSWIVTASGAGSVTGALIVAGASHLKNRGRSAIISQIAFAIALLTFALSRNIFVSVAAVFFAGAFLLGVVTSVSSLVQLRATEEVRGRVMSIFMMAFRGGMPLGNLLTGWVAEQASVSVALGINAVALLLIGLTLLVYRRGMSEI
jgi:MFS family permease